jgi:predicted nuclease of restriction endonuclease-like (RecB) superfamily
VEQFPFLWRDRLGEGKRNKKMEIGRLWDMASKRKSPEKGLLHSEKATDATVDPLSLPTGYPELLEDIKTRVHASRIRASLSVNNELITLYWEIGRLILKRQEAEGWGARVIDRLSADLRREFPDMKGFSSRNLKYMRAFAESYTQKEIVQQAAAQIPWFHNCVILDKVQDAEQRQWYIRATVMHGWSRAVLVHQIESGLYRRQGAAQTNFQAILPAPQSDLAQELLKDPYNFEFLGLSQDISERQLEKALVSRLKDFLLELGMGFAFVAEQYHLDVGDEDYYIDLLFYHLQLRCYVIIDLKVVPFKPEFAGKMNFYLSAVDDQVRHPDDQPSIGLILCKERNRLVVEYALRDTTKPMGVATYRILPQKLKSALPTARQIEKGIGMPESR